MSTITETICCCFLIITRRDEIQLLYLLRSNRTHETWQSWSQYSTNKCDPRFNIKFPFSSSVFVINIRTGYCTASQVSTLNKFSEIFSALDALVSDSVLGRWNVSWHGEICRAGGNGCVNMVISWPCLLSRRSTIIVFTPETCSADLTLVYMIQWLETDHWSPCSCVSSTPGSSKIRTVVNTSRKNVEICLKTKLLLIHSCTHSWFPIFQSPSKLWIRTITIQMRAAELKGGSLTLEWQSYLPCDGSHTCIVLLLTIVNNIVSSSMDPL